MHICLGGTLDLMQSLVASLDPLWEYGPEEVRQRWQHDKILLEIAGNVRKQRLATAWATYSSSK